MPSDSVFKPVTPDQLSGPFSGFLQPTRIQEQNAEQGPPVLAGKGTSLGYLASKFIQGASEGRVKAFEAQENAKIQKFQTFQGYVQQIYSNPLLTDEAKQMALQKLSQVMGQYGTEAAGKGGGKSGKGGGGGADGKAGGIKEHVANMARDVFQGMTGGKMPKGAPDVGGAMAELHAAIYDEKGQPKPQYNVQGIVAENQKDIKRKSEALPPGATLDEWHKAVMPNLEALRRHAPHEAEAIVQSYSNIYQPAPKYGTQEYYDRQWAQIHGQGVPGQPPVPPPSNVGAPPSATPVAGFTPAQPPQPATGTPPAGPPQGPPQGKVFSPGEWGLIQSAGYATKPQGVEYTGPNKQLVRTFAQFVTTPDGFSGWIDPSGRQLTAPDVRPASATEPPRDRVSHVTNYPVKGDTKGHSGTLNLDTGEFKDSGVTPVAAGTKSNRPAFDLSQHPQVVLAQRKIKTMEALNKVISQTPIPAGTQGPALAKYLWDHVQQYYKTDKDVSPYMPDILNWINEEARKGNLKDQKSAADILKAATGQATQDLKDTKGQAQMDYIQHTSDALFDQMFSAPSGGGGPMLNEFDR